MKTLHFECFAGISGDMALGALLDAGADKDALLRELAKLPVEGWALEFHRESRGGIFGIHPVVIMADGSTEHIAENENNKNESHNNEHNHSHEHEHRHWSNIRTMIEKSELKSGAKNYALKIFSTLAQAEAEVHGSTIDEVAFHEVGALDSIIDIVGTAICLDMLSPQKITSSAVELGGGTVKCAHGILPVPAPAVLKLVRGIPCTEGGFQKEMTTPTGAAILRACVDEFITEPYAFIQIKEGIGIGTRKLDKPNFLRVSLREINKNEISNNQTSKLWEIEKLITMECTIDDMTGEDFALLQKCLFDSGALDVAFIPCTMKKNRPGIFVNILARRENLDAVRITLFTKSTTIGFREFEVNRLSLRREEGIIESETGPLRVKKVFLGEKFLRQKIEYDDRARNQ